MVAINNDKNRRLGIAGCRARLISLMNGKCYFEVEKDGIWSKWQCSESMLANNFKSSSEPSSEAMPETTPFKQSDFKKY